MTNLNFNELTAQLHPTIFESLENWTMMKFPQRNQTLKWSLPISNLAERNSSDYYIEFHKCTNASLLCSANISTTIYPKYFHLYPIEQWKMHRFFTEEYLKLVNTHWFEYPPPNKQIHYIFAAVYLLVMLVGVSGNFLLIFMILSFRTLRTSSNILILNLAVSDFLMVAKMPVFIYNSLYFGPVLGEMGCHLYGFIGGLSGTASILTLAAIAMDRYLGIAHPLNFHQRRAKRRIIAWITFIWVYSATFASIPLSHIGVKTYVPEGFLTSCSFDYLSNDLQNRCFIFIYFVAAWCLPLLVIATSYVGICREVLRVSLIRKGQEREQRKREAKLSAILALATILWFLSWTPYAAVALLGIFGYKNHITPLASMIPALFCKTAACINSFIYGLNHPRLRQQLLKLCCKKRYNLDRTQFSRSWRNTSCSFKLKEQSLCNVSQSRLRRASTVASEPSEHSTHLM